MILCRTLGPVEVSVDGGPAPPDLLWRKHLALLIYLARSPRRVRSRDHLVGLLWGDRDRGRRAALPERGAAGDPPPRRRDDAVETARRAGPARRRASWRWTWTSWRRWPSAEDWEAAAELIAGEFLEGFAVPGASEFEDWLAAEREHWRRRGVEVLVRGSEALLRAGRTQEASALAARALALEPDLRARPRRRRSAASRSPATAPARWSCSTASATRLAEEVGTEPGEEIRALVERVRRERGVRAEVAAGGATGEPVVRPPLEGRGQGAGPAARGVGRLGTRAAGRRCSCSRANPAWARPGCWRRRWRGCGSTACRIAAARAVEADRAEPWSGVLALARGGLVDAAGIGAAPPEALAAFAAPAARVAESGSPARRPTAASRSGRALVRVLRAAAEEQPLVLAVDDAQWLDPDSASALGAVLRDLSRPRR